MQKSGGRGSKGESSPVTVDRFVVVDWIRPIRQHRLSRILRPSRRRRRRSALHRDRRQDVLELLPLAALCGCDARQPENSLQQHVQTDHRRCVVLNAVGRCKDP